MNSDSANFGEAGSSALPAPHPQPRFWPLTLGAIGVVYGDIGTSPLYAFREAATAAATGGRVTQEIVIGILSLIVWALVLVVTVKYVFILLRADNNGEGGTLSLLALALRALKRGRNTALWIGLVGAGLFYGDALITPAISVLSAVEGLKLVTPALSTYVVPITVTILASLFAVQSRGTGKVAVFFGPVVTVWFFVLGLTGLLNISNDPSVLLAFSPKYGVGFLLSHPGVALAVLGGVALVATGAEAALRGPRSFWSWSHTHRMARVLKRLPGLKFMRTLWVCEASGGPFEFKATKRGKTPLGLEEAHRDLRISPAEFDEVAAELGRTLDFAKVAKREKAEVLAAFATHKDEVTAGYIGAKRG